MELPHAPRATRSRFFFAAGHLRRIGIVRRARASGNARAAFIALTVLAAAVVTLASCASSSAVGYGALANRRGPGVERGQGGEAIMGAGQASQERLVSFFLENNRAADPAKVARMARYYVEESRAEGVNSDVAFAQMCLETGFLRFGGLVTMDMNNFCGLGSIGPGKPGVRFPDERTGVRAHVQHLKGYATAQPLGQPAADPRYRYINPKGKAPTVASLSGTWAADRAYGPKLRALVEKIRS
jgi:hypothetical protein